MSERACLDWLLEPENPSARYLALRHLCGHPETDDAVRAARAGILHLTQVRAILDAQYPAGYWVKPDRGYSPRHRATVWQLIVLADLGTPRTEAIARGCEHVLAHTLRRQESLFSAHVHSTGILPCLNGDLLRVMWHFGFGDHPVVRAVGDSLARRVLRDGWTCPRNGARSRDRTTWQLCPWGCVKVLRGFAAVPVTQRSPSMDKAVESGVAYLDSCDLACDLRPSLVQEPSHWLQFGFPLGYGSDMLEALLALTELGISFSQPAAWEVVKGKQDAAGRWPLEHSLRGAWADFGSVGEPSKWITLRALCVQHAQDRAGVS